jgi:hypothetical protein
VAGKKYGDNKTARAGENLTGPGCFDPTNACPFHESQNSPKYFSLLADDMLTYGKCDFTGLTLGRLFFIMIKT